MFYFLQGFFLVHTFYRTGIYMQGTLSIDYKTVMNIPQQVHSIYSTLTPKWSITLKAGSLGQRVDWWAENALAKDSLHRIVEEGVALQRRRIE